MDLNTIWFLLIGVLFVFYMILDGFDLGVGILYMFAKTDEEKKMHTRAIGPFWDGNEVWLVAGVGATFAAFPGAYTTVLSSLYIPTMLLIFFLVFRAVSIEFCNHVHSPHLSKIWDVSFGVGSFGVAFIIGVILGNMLQGFPIGPTGVRPETLFELIDSFTLLCGLLSVSICVMHGAIFLQMKSFGIIENRLRNHMFTIWAGTTLLIILVGIAAFTSVPNLWARIDGHAIFYILFACFILSQLLIVVFKAQPRAAFAFSSLSISLLGIMVGGVHFPNIVPSSIDRIYGLSIYNTASDPKTHMLMLGIAIIGVPLVLVYTGIVYRVFRGKVNLKDGGYEG